MLIDIPVVHTPHGINQKIETSFINKCYIKFERFFSFLITAIIYVSKTEFNYGQKLKIWPTIPSHIIYNGTQIISLEEKVEWRNLKREQLNWTNEKVVITASRFDFQKNTIEFCKIAGQLPQFYFAILGDGEEKKECEHFCKTAGINNVLFVGNVPDPLSYFAAADVYLSTARWEGLSMAILESMAVGLPIVATNVIGNTDLVKSQETGFLYTIGDVNEAVKCLLCVFEDLNYLKFSANVKTFHSISFSSESMCQKTIALYKGILNSKSKN
jgi:glycosyltransferase involved in cell wall biosynthesis